MCVKARVASGYASQVSQAVRLPLPLKQDTVSQPVKAWKPGSAADLLCPSCSAMLHHHTLLHQAAVCVQSCRHYFSLCWRQTRHFQWLIALKRWSLLVYCVGFHNNLEGCWKRDISIPWNGSVLVVELRLWLRLSTAAVVNRLHFKVGGQTHFSCSNKFTDLWEMSADNSSSLE